MCYVLSVSLKETVHRVWETPPLPERADGDGHHPHSPQRRQDSQHVVSIQVRTLLPERDVIFPVPVNWERVLSYPHRSAEMFVSYLHRWTERLSCLTCTGKQGWSCLTCTGKQRWSCFTCTGNFRGGPLTSSCKRRSQALCSEQKGLQYFIDAGCDLSNLSWFVVISY